MPGNDSTNTATSRAELLYSHHDLRSDQDLCSTSHLIPNLQKPHLKPFLHSTFAPLLSPLLQTHNHCHLAQHLAQRRLHDDEADAFALIASTRWRTVATSAIAGQVLGCSYAGIRTWQIWQNPLSYPAAAPGLQFRGSSLLNPASRSRAWVRVLGYGNWGMAVATFLGTSYSTLRARATLDRDPRLSEWRQDVDCCIYEHLAELVSRGPVTEPDSRLVYTSKEDWYCALMGKRILAREYDISDDLRHRYESMLEYKCHKYQGMLECVRMWPLVFGGGGHRSALYDVFYPGWTASP